MKMGKHRRGRVGIGLVVLLALALMTVYLASCSGTSSKKTTTSSKSTKLPPGTTESQVKGASTTTSQAQSSQASSSSTSGTSSTTTTTTATTPSTSADLVGARFTVVSATRLTTNKSVISSSSREVTGDYLNVELKVQNVGTGLVDLSEYSFRLYSPGIDADSYSDYYGTTTTYGAYVTTNTISGTLMDYTSLSAVAYKVKIGEEVDKVFLFYDLNPQNVAKNTGVTKDNTSLIIKKVSGTDYGEKVSIPLTGYPD
jgi:hypothetical protein